MSNFQYKQINTALKENNEQPFYALIPIENCYAMAHFSRKGVIGAGVFKKSLKDAWEAGVDLDPNIPKKKYIITN